MTGVVDLLRELVAISSVSRESNRRVISLAEQWLSNAGWLVEQHVYHDNSGVEKINLLAWPARLPTLDRRFHLALVCHTDTVPYSEQWAEATTLVEDDGDLKGCGACDVKGFLACILWAISGLDLARLNQPVCVLLTADEEIGCVGARYLADKQALRAKFAIVGEPTSLRPVRAGKGYCLAEITVGGREAHSAFPERGVSAIFRAAKLLAEIEKIEERLKSFAVEGFSPPWTTINVGEIHGGSAKNIVAPWCRFLLEWRPVPGQNPAMVPDLVATAIQQLTTVDPSWRCEVDILRTQEGFAVDPGSELLLSLMKASGNGAESVAFGTEAPWLKKMGAETVVFGPGSMESAHSPREFVPETELERCVEILRTVVYDLCR